MTVCTSILNTNGLYFLDDSVIGMYLLVQIDTLRSEQFFSKKKNASSTPRRETARARPRPPPAEFGEASKVRHDEQTAHRPVDLIASKFVYGSKTGVKTTLSIAHTQHLTQHLTHHHTYG